MAKINKIKQLHPHNAYTFYFDKAVLAEAEFLYQIFKSDPESNEFHMTPFSRNGVRWIACNSYSCYQRFESIFFQLQIPFLCSDLIDYQNKIQLYCGFFVSSFYVAKTLWHVDYSDDSMAYTLMLPLLFERGHGHLLYEDNDLIKQYIYKNNEAIVFGDGFVHSTQPYHFHKTERVMLCFTFGTDKMSYWPKISETVAKQSLFYIKPCGHVGTECRCQ